MVGPLKTGYCTHNAARDPPDARATDLDDPLNMDKRLLDILCCPTTKVSVRLLARPELEALNRAIDGGGIRNAAGLTLSKSLDGGLITRDGKTIYRIEDGIPVMLADEAVESSQVDGLTGT
ncbi:MAG: Trm112 family protein [Rhodanobacteraceae bacterium]